ncbi:MAG TPA: sugar phosphate isomerase/epimerase [Levilinea sp.]|nr:sugar phosphate isomerase/epimerase [Levilinea sp.]
MTVPIALQLYSVREQIEQDFAGTVRKVAEMGYAGVETAGFPSTTPAEAGKLFRALGLHVPGAHSPLPIGDQRDSVIAAMQATGCRRIISGGIGAEHYQTLDSIRRACENFNAAAQIAKVHGMTFGVHNHWWEVGEVEGRWVFDVLLEELDPSIFFELDTYWIQAAGVNAAEFVAKYGSRAPLLHIKDGPVEIDKPHLAVGSGAMDIPAVVKAGAGTTEWLVVELDNCDTDMLEAVKDSYQYLVREGLGHGR